MAVVIADINGEDSLREWLRKRPTEDARHIAFRAALRILPFLAQAEEKDTFGNSVLLPTLWAHNVARVAGTWPARVADLSVAASASATSANRAANTTSNVDAAFAANRAADSARAVYSIQSAASAARTDPRARAARAAIREDAFRLEGTRHHTELGMTPLWTNRRRPEWFEDEWERCWNKLRKMGDGWEVWIQWYQDIIDGKPADEETQLQIALIPEEIWKQGAKVVNAEVARILESASQPDVVEELREFTDELQALSEPSLPDRDLTPVKFIFDGELIDAAKPDAPEASADREALARQGWSAVRNQIEDVIEFGGGQQDQRLARILERCLSAMGASFADLDIIAVGQCQTRLNPFASRAHEEMLDGAADELTGLNAQIILFLRQFPDWDHYLEGVATALGSEAEEADAVPHLAATVEALGDVLSGTAQAKLADLRDDASPETTPDNPDPIPAVVPRRSWLLAGKDLLVTVFSTLLSPISDGVKDGVKKVIAAAVIGGAIHLTALAGALPAKYAWLTPVVEHVVKTFAK